MRCLWLLYELGIDFNVITLPFDNLRTEEYLKIHELGRVPALRVDDLILYESGAICQHLSETYSPNVLGRSCDHSDRAQWLQWLHYSETMAVHAASLTQQHIVIQEAQLRSNTVQKLERRRLQKSLEVVENHLEDKEYLLNSGFSTADIAVGYSIHLAGYFVDLETYSNLPRYYHQLRRREAFLRSMPNDDDALRIFQRTYHQNEQ